jgi:hypothetical protein
MIWIGWPTVNADRTCLASVLFALLHDVMVIVAERLPVGSIPEQLLIATMRHLVVNDQADAARVRLRRAVHVQVAWVEQTTFLALDAELVPRLPQEVGTLTTPLGVIAALASRRSCG